MADIAPGAGTDLRAPLRFVTRKDDTQPIDIVEATGNPDDAGRYWPLIARGFNGSDDFDIGIYELAPGEYHPRHYHPAGAEFYFVIAGSGTVHVNGRDEAVEVNTAIAFPSHVVHALRAGDDGITVLYGFNSGDCREAGTVWVE